MHDQLDKIDFLLEDGNSLHPRRGIRRAFLLTSCCAFSCHLDRFTFRSSPHYEQPGRLHFIENFHAITGPRSQAR